MNKIFRNKSALLILTLPALILFTIAVTYPTTQSLIKSFFEWDGLGKPEYTGFNNYIHMFGDEDFIISVKNGLIFTAVMSVYQIVVSTILALFISGKKLPGRKFFRSSFFIPVVLTVTITSQLWVSILDGNSGVLNKFFETLGLNYSQDWLSQTKSVIYAIALVTAWQYVGYYVILLYSAMKGIPEHYFEAATIDGANSLQRFFKVTIPLLSETYKICLIMILTGGLKVFEPIFIMTRGGPGNASYTLSMLIYKVVFKSAEYGYGSAIAIVLVLQCLLVLALINRFVARERITY